MIRVIFSVFVLSRIIHVDNQPELFAQIVEKPSIMLLVKSLQRPQVIINYL